MLALSRCEQRAVLRAVTSRRALGRVQRVKTRSPRSLCCRFKPPGARVLDTMIVPRLREWRERSFRIPIRARGDVVRIDLEVGPPSASRTLCTLTNVEFSQGDGKCDAEAAERYTRGL